jgi:uncharacterized membrane protein (DUF485 family)
LKCKVLLSMIRFNFGYFLLAIILFGVEVIIAAYVHDPWIRPFGGDFLVVILLYTFIKSFLNTPVTPTAIVTLIIAYSIETGQYFQLIYRLGWGQSAIARNILGTNFAWGDILAYTLGIVVVILVEQVRRKRK